MITKEQLMLGSRITTKLKTFSGVLSLIEAQDRFDTGKDIIVIANRKAHQLFFTDVHHFGIECLSTDWIPRTIKASFLMSETDEKNEDSIDTVVKFINVYYKDFDIITTIDNLLQMLNRDVDILSYIEQSGIRKEAAELDIYFNDDISQCLTVLVQSSNAYTSAKRISDVTSGIVHVRHNTQVEAIFSNGICIQQ